MFPINFAAKVWRHRLVTPTEEDMKRLKRCARWLKGCHQTHGQFLPVEGAFDVLDVYCDTDHAGDKVTRRSTTSVMVTIGGCIITDSARQQTVYADSSGVSEYYGMCSGAADGLMVQAAMEHCGIDVPVRLRVDSSAAKAIATRQGIGKLKFLEI